MIVRFNTHEEAGIYSGRMRAEGHYAEVLDEGTGFLWGPMAVGGFRVVVTEEPVADEFAEQPEQSPDTEFGRLVRFLVVGLAAGGAAAAVLISLWTAGKGDGTNPAMMVPVSLLALLLGGAVMAPLCLAMTRALRDERSKVGAVLRALAVLYVLGTLATMAAVAVRIIISLVRGHP